MESISKSIWDIPFVVCDVETTGSNAQLNSITEISCVTTLSGEITSEFSTLIKSTPNYSQFHCSNDRNNKPNGIFSP
jgi:DNA polymerase-3 subunit epsilon